MAAEEEAKLDSLRECELRLLRCSIPSPSPSPSPSSFEPPDDSDTAKHGRSLYALIEDVVSSIEAGDYVRALSSDAARTIFTFSGPSSSPSPDRFYSELVLNRVESFLFEDEKDPCHRAFLLMAIAVASFLAFTQCNITGPFDGLPSLPLEVFDDGGDDRGGAEWEVWAQNQLMAAGSDLLGKFSNLQYIVFAKILLTKMKDLLSQGKVSSVDGIRSISWWLARLFLLQQRMLDERSSSLFDLLQVYTAESLHCFGTLEKVTSYWGSKLLEEEALAIVSMLYLEAGIMEHTYGRVDPSRLHFKSAEVASGLQLSVTGSLGFRTVHQVEPKAQLLLVANSRTSNDAVELPSIKPDVHRNASSIDGDDFLRHRRETCEASDVLLTPRFIEDDRAFENAAQGEQNCSIAAAPLKANQQAVILAQCLFIEKSTPHDEMQRWEMAPYIEAVDSQLSSYFIIRCFCDILRIRWESTRSRTKERALLMMDKLVQGISGSSPGVAQRIYYSFGAYIPTIPALRKEYGELLVSCGLIGEAVKVFEDLELWDNLIHCYCLLEKKAAAVELIRVRLSEMPNDPRLWCSLGDITRNDACYEKALEVSGNRSARAKRSLARSAYNRGDYEKSKVLWESAMALNSYYPDGWFALGAAALKARDVEKAMDAFTSAVQLDPENGEAWNNIACLRSSWQLWENFSHVAADVGNLSQASFLALEAAKTVLDMTSNKRTDAQFLERMMLEIEGQTLTRTSQSHVATNDHKYTNQTCSADSDINCAHDSTDSEVVLVKTQETDRLVELLGKILRQIVQSGGGSEIWGLYARWHKLKGDLTMCSEALLKQVRSYQGSDLWRDSDRFKKFAHASLELCKVYMELFSCSGGRREFLAAEMHLRNTIKQAGSFSETEEFRDLQACLDEVQMKLQASSAPSA
ncbi:Tetratricopeptide repeat protein [Actinidia chinensis var. chinensis]|uniref:Tetratricopeptide repeat protein n=1 Tax=Actinidia chinensis var. chinensis TaxID=1590841 RepID=A0A2R6QXE8_ACTCC|nr:Tetratricopeptide repeat protein [Actinidia chinensis var. chinensis]